MGVRDGLGWGARARARRRWPRPAALLGDDDLTGVYPELAGLGEQLGSTVVALDGEASSRSTPSPAHPITVRLREREGLTGSAARRLARTQPVTYLVYDVLHLDGHPTVEPA